MPKEVREIEIEVKHHFTDGLYTREHRIPKGALVVTHSHNFNHTSILCSGKVIVNNDGEEFAYQAPQVLHIEAEKHHSIYAIDDAVWMCIHATECTDVSEIEHKIIN